MRSPIGEGARRGLAPSLMVADRLWRGKVLLEKGEVFDVGVTAELGGVPGGKDALELSSYGGFAKAPALMESRRRRPEPRSSWGSGMLDAGAG